MNDLKTAGLLLRMLRLEKNWSQETLCRGICTVSYLSKIEQGKATPNRELMDALFSRLDVVWNDAASPKLLRDELYESIFAWDDANTRQCMAVLEEHWHDYSTGPCYADFVIIRAYHNASPQSIPKELEPLLDSRQRALYLISRNDHNEAYRIYPCPLTAFCVAEEAYRKGNYTLALEYLQIACDQAAREGYVYLQMYGQHYMSNCYSDMGNLDAMYRHGRIAIRLGKALGQEELVRTINYNIAATKAEFGDYKGAFDYLSGLEAPNIMELHKLAICCEGLGQKAAALQALDRADSLMSGSPLEKKMCALVRHRLENPGYLHDPAYGALLLDTFQRIRSELHFGYARFHLRWVTEWLTANRQYRAAYELLLDFPNNHI